MRVAKVGIKEYSGAVVGARGAERSWPTRHGLALTVETSEGIVGQGEASPLPGYSRETLDAARESLARFDWTAVPEPDPSMDMDELCTGLRGIGDKTLLPSARFAVETAFLDILGQRAARPIWSLLGAVAGA